MLQELSANVTPRGLIMSLFNAPDNTNLSIGQLISVGALFNIEAATIRMTVTRLLKEKLIGSESRGNYRAGEKAASLNLEIQSWRRTTQKTKAWKGEWLLALTSHLGRSNRTQLRSVARAFQLYGFIEIELGIWIRPANLIQPVNFIRQNLIELGMDSRVMVMNVNNVSGGQHNEWCSKWPVDELEKNYKALISTMETSLNALSQMSNQDAAKETLLIGESAIRVINLDPLLPKEIVDTSLFKKLVTTMIKYDHAGQRYWQEFLSS